MIRFCLLFNIRYDPVISSWMVIDAYHLYCGSLFQCVYQVLFEFQHDKHIVG